MKRLMVGLAAAFAAWSLQAETLHLAGDSTLAWRSLKDPVGSWGEKLRPALRDGNEIVNYAISGTSTVTFRPQWEKKLVPNIKKGDFVIVQFGHNDPWHLSKERIAKGMTDRYCTVEDYRANLTRFVREAQAKGASVLLLTPTPQRAYFGGSEWKISARHAPYFATIPEVARETGADFIDMTELGGTVVQAKGVEGSREFYRADAKGKGDDVHLNKDGARMLARVFLREVQARGLAVGKLFDMEAYFGDRRADALYRCQVHRGGGRDTRPDNALETFLWCWGHGVAPEADARLTTNGVAIALHDNTLKRVGRGIPAELAKAQVGTLTWEQIRDVDVGSYLGPEYASTRISTMESIFAAMAGRPDRMLYLDEKGAPPEMMAAMAKRYGIEKQIYYTSSDYRLMARWKKVVPDGLGMVWLGTWPKVNTPETVAKADRFLEDTFAKMEKDGWAGISQVQIHVRTDVNQADPFCPSSEEIRRAIRRLHAHGITVQAFTWTEGANKNVLKRLWDLGFDNYATDDPMTLFELVEELKRK